MSRFELRPRSNWPGVLALLCACGAATLFLYTHADPSKPADEAPVRPWGWILLLVVGAVAAWLLEWHRAVRGKLVVDDEGLEQAKRRLAWGDASHYHYSSAADLRGVEKQLLSGRLPRFLIKQRRDEDNAVLVVVGRDGKRFAFGPGEQRRAAIELAFEKLHTLGSTDYHPFALGDNTFSEGEREMPFAELERVEIAGGTIRIHRRGKELLWSEKYLDQVRNPLLLVEALRARAVPVEIELRAPLPLGIARAPAETAVAQRSRRIDG